MYCGVAETKAQSDGSDGKFIFKSKPQSIRQIKAVAGNAFCCQTGQFSQDVVDGALTFYPSVQPFLNQWHK